MGYEVYCPTIKTLKQWSDRKKKVEEPLFRSYVFIKMAPHEVSQIYWVPGFSRFVNWLGKPVIVRESEIESIKMFLNRVVHDSIQIDHFTVGDQITIRSGALKKVKGVVLKIGKRKAVLQIDSLGTLIKAEVALSDLVA
jgi:transcription antitermination factor NusG